MPRHEHFLINASPDESAPSSRHSQQLGESADAPSGLIASVDINDDDNMVLHVDDVVMEEQSLKEVVAGGPVAGSSSRSEQRRILFPNENNSSNCIVMGLPKRSLAVSFVLLSVLIAFAFIRFVFYESTNKWLLPREV